MSDVKPSRIMKNKWNFEKMTDSALSTVELDAQKRLIKVKPEKQQKEEMSFLGQHSFAWLGQTLINL